MENIDLHGERRADPTAWLPVRFGVAKPLPLHNRNSEDEEQQRSLQQQLVGGYRGGRHRSTCIYSSTDDCGMMGYVKNNARHELLHAISPLAHA